MALSLLAGPANAGKVALLLERYLGALDSDPVLIVPNRPDVDRAELELLRHAGALVGGSIGTFDDLFERLARGNGAHRPVVTEAQRTLLLRRVVARARPDGLGRSARFAGFADALGQTVSELESGLVEPGELEGELAELYQAYRDELDRLGVWDRELERRHAAERIAGELDAWDGRPVFAYGFEDLTGAEWSLLEALAARSEVAVSLPYEPGRDAFASLSRTSDDLNALAEHREELPSNPAARGPVLTHLERALFSESAGGAPPLDGSLRFLEGAGLRGTLELLAEEILAVLRAGTPAEEIGVVCPSLDRWRAALDTAFATLGVPYALAGLDLRTHERVARVAAELEGWRDFGGELTREEIVGLLEHTVVRLAGAGEAGRVAVLDLLRARTRRFEVVFVLGLEEGRLPRRERESPFPDDDAPPRLGPPPQRPDGVSPPRHPSSPARPRPPRRLSPLPHAPT